MVSAGWRFWTSFLSPGFLGLTGDCAQGMSVEPRGSLEHNLRAIVLELGLPRNEEGILPSRSSTLYLVSQSKNHRRGHQRREREQSWYTCPAMHLEILAMTSDDLPIGFFSIRRGGFSFRNGLRKPMPVSLGTTHRSHKLGAEAPAPSHLPSH